MPQWGQFAELRASILDGLSMVAKTIVAVHTPKGRQVPEFPTQPRPETALERAQREQRDSAMSALEALVQPLNKHWES